MLADGNMARDGLGTKLAQLEDRKATARRQLDRLNEGQRRVNELKATKRALLGAYADGILYDGLRWFTPEMRREIY